MRRKLWPEAPAKEGALGHNFLRMRVPWATIFYAFQHNKNERNEGFFDTMFSNL